MTEIGICIALVVTNVTLIFGALAHCRLMKRVTELEVDFDLLLEGKTVLAHGIEDLQNRVTALEKEKL